MKNNLYFKKENKKFSLKDILLKINYNSAEPIANINIHSVNNLKDANINEISLLNNLKYIDYAKNTKAAACIINKNYRKYFKNNSNVFLIESKNPLIDFYKIVSLFYPTANKDDEIINYINVNNLNLLLLKKVFFGKNCLIDKSARIGEKTYIGNNVIVKKHVTIGKNCNIGSNVIIENALIGDNVLIKSGTLIGQIGFGFGFEKNKRIRFPHIGRVVIENDVQIGSMCTIDRGSLSDTIIGEFSSIDNQVQIAHNVIIGNYCMIAAQCGIAGSTSIGNYVKIGGQSGISGHLKIGNNVQIGGKSGVISDIEDNKIVMGYPAKNIREFIKNKQK